MVPRLIFIALTVLAPTFSISGTSQEANNETRAICQALNTCVEEDDLNTVWRTRISVEPGKRMTALWNTERVIAKPIPPYLTQSQPERPNIATSSSAPRPATCDDIEFPFFGPNSKEAVEGFIEHEILKNHKKYGSVDWDCLIKKFEFAEENTSVVVYKDVPSLAGSDVYRFTVDRRGSFLASVLGIIPVPGGSNGQYTAIVRNTVNDEIAIIQRGGIPKWLKLE